MAKPEFLFHSLIDRLCCDCGAWGRNQQWPQFIRVVMDFIFKKKTNCTKTSKSDL